MPSPSPISESYSTPSFQVYLAELRLHPERHSDFRRRYMDDAFASNYISYIGTGSRANISLISQLDEQLRKQPVSVFTRSQLMLDLGLLNLCGEYFYLVYDRLCHQDSGNLRIVVEGLKYGALSHRMLGDYLEATGGNYIKQAATFQNWEAETTKVKRDTAVIEERAYRNRLAAALRPQRFDLN